MFYLTLATRSGAVQLCPPLSAIDAIRTWEQEEPEWHRVICLDGDHEVITQGRLREIAAGANRPQ